MNESQARDLGRLITSRRMKLNLSIRVLERGTGIPKAWIAKFEAGGYRSPGMDRLFAIALALGLDPEEMNAASGGYLASRLPSTRAYFRAKHGLKHEDIDRLIDQLDIED